jgi:hypothetical protein
MEFLSSSMSVLQEWDWLFEDDFYDTLFYRHERGT